MKVTALGVHSAFAVGEILVIPGEGPIKQAYVPKFQSNFLLEFDVGKERSYRFVIDFGSDIRHSLAYSAGLKMGDIDAWYCSHPHADHIGGVEGIALSTFFNPFWRPEKADWAKSVNGGGNLNIADACLKAGAIPDEFKPEMFGHKEVLKELWQAASPGLQTLQGMRKVDLSTYFTIRPMVSNVEKKIQDGSRLWKYYTIESTHVMSGTSSMPSYGLMFECSDGQKIYFPTDSLFFMPPMMKSFYLSADVIYQDCETGPKSGVHSHIDDITKAEPDVKKKLYLYHFTDAPKVEEGEYRGVLTTGEIHEY